MIEFCFFCLFRSIELFPSSYDDAKRRIMDDARLNAKRFVGEEDDDVHEKNTDYDNNNNTNMNHNHTKRVSRSRSRQRSRSKSNSRGLYFLSGTFFNVIYIRLCSDYRQRETRRRHSPAASSPRSSRRKTQKRTSIKFYLFSFKHHQEALITVSHKNSQLIHQMSSNILGQYNNDRRRSRSRSPIRHSSSRSGEHVIKIRGMPYTVIEEDIRKVHICLSNN